MKSLNVERIERPLQEATSVKRLTLSLHSAHGEQNGQHSERTNGKSQLRKIKADTVTSSVGRRASIDPLVPPSAVKMPASLLFGVYVVWTVQALPRESLVTGGEADTERI